MIDLTPLEMTLLHQCVDLAQQALAAGNAPFGALIADANGQVLQRAQSQTHTVDITQHPEFALARWAAANLSLEQRQAATVYTTVEHCPMCATANGLAEIGHVTYIVSGQQLGKWYKNWGMPPKPTTSFPIQTIAPKIQVVGPVKELQEAVKELQKEFVGRIK